MVHRKDGRVTFSKSEFEELTGAYNALYDCLNDAPTTLQDYFTWEEHVAIARWMALLNSEEFVLADYLDPNDDPELVKEEW